MFFSINLGKIEQEDEAEVVVVEKEEASKKTKADMIVLVKVTLIVPIIGDVMTAGAGHVTVAETGAETGAETRAETVRMTGAEKEVETDLMSRERADM